MQNFRALGAPPPDPRASGGWGLFLQTPSLQRLGASPPDPQKSPPLQISGYAPGLIHDCDNFLLFKIELRPIIKAWVNVMGLFISTTIKTMSKAIV